MDTEYRLVEIHDAQSVSEAPGVVQHPKNKETPDVPWYRNGIKIGISLPTSILKQVTGLEKVQKKILNSNGLRQLTVGHIHTSGSDIGGYFALADFGSAWLYKDSRDANKWAKQIDRKLAPSLTLIDSGQGNVSFVLCFVLSSKKRRETKVTYN